MPKHRIAIIGLGMAVTPHAKSLIDLKDRVEVAAAFSPSEARRKAFGEKFPFPLAGGLDAILADKSIDCVEILTPPNTHLDLVKQCAAAGKHILLEKPLEVSTERALELVETAAKAGVTLAVMLQHRFRPAGMKLREMLRAGELGRIVNCSTVIRLWRPQSYYDVEGRGTKARDGGGVLITQGIHTLDLMLSLAGPIAEVRGYRDDLERASHGDRGSGRGGGALRERRVRHDRRHHRGLSGLCRAHRDHRREGDRVARSAAI